MTHLLVICAKVAPLTYDVHKSLCKFGPLNLSLFCAAGYVLATPPSPSAADVLHACPLTLSEEGDLCGRDRGRTRTGGADGGWRFPSGVIRRLRLRRRRRG